MIYKYLPLALLLVINTPLAKGNITDSTEQSSTITLAGSNSNTSMYALAEKPAALYSRYSGGGEASVHGFYDIDLGYASATAKSNGSSATGGGFMYAGEIGAKIFIPGHSQNKTGIISISIYGTEFTIKEKYKDAQGESKTDKLQFGVAALPLSFSSMSYGRNGSGSGYYWQVGVNIDYISKVKDNDNTVTSHYSSIYFEPCISGGLSVPFVMRDVKRHKDMGGGRALIGPFLAYAATNMSKDSGVTMNGYRVGIKWTYIFM